MESTAEVRPAVRLVLTGAASFSFCCVLTALAPHTHLFTTALLIFTARLRGQRKCFSYFSKQPTFQQILSATHDTHLQFNRAETHSINNKHEDK